AVDTGRGDGSVVPIVPQPLQSPKELVWVAASSHGAAQVAGELGYHLLLPSLRPLEASQAHVETYRGALARAGHSPAGLKLQLTVDLVLRQDHDEAVRLAEPIVRAYYERYVASGAVQRLDDESLDAIMRRINFAAGGPEAVATRLAELQAALGLTHVAF